ncbi:MAG TPA: UbiA-like polyprenyltransferase [Abditibacteriaceae bacterium]|jgi:4-hydroxybenzoate polyprenyltransferase
MNESAKAPEDSRPPIPKLKSRMRDYLELVKFSHTLFALPFALAAMLVASEGHPQARTFGWILVAMVGARTAAMGFNRIVDRDIDRRNPRTANREIPAGKVSIAQAATLVVISALLFLFASWQLNNLAFWLAFPTLAVLFFYSYCKRFTSLAHFVLGMCLGIAPAGAWVAVRGSLDWPPVALALGIMFWVAGFDVIYATMDNDFDREAGIHSLVQKLGMAKALEAAKFFHAIFIVLLALFGRLIGFPPLYYCGVGAIAIFLIYEHSMVSERDLRKVNEAFFTVNGAIAVFFLLLTAFSLWLMQFSSIARPS